MKILITGASGFAGRHLAMACLAAGHDVVGSLRHPDRPRLPDIAYVVVGDLDGETDWSSAVQGVDAVIHTAARVHVKHEPDADLLTLYRRTNREASFNLACQAAAAGAKRFIFISSIAAQKAEDSEAAKPPSPYGLSKWEAERGLAGLAAEHRFGLVVLRPPMIYGPQAPGAFSQLARALAWGLPLPLGGIRNKRSVLYIGNLCDAALLCLTHPEAPGHVFALSDGGAVSTSQLARAIAKAQRRPGLLLPCPQRLLRRLGHITGRERQVNSLLNSLVVDDGAIRERLGWSPPWTLEAALEATFRGESTRSEESTDSATQVT